MKRFFFILFVLLVPNLIYSSDVLIPKISLTSRNGKITVIDPTKVIGIKHTNVNTSKNWWLSVLEIKPNGEIVEGKYRYTAVKFAQKANDLGVPFQKVHKGQFFNMMHFDRVTSFVTQNSTYFNRNVDIKKCKKAYKSKYSHLGKRNGILIIDDIAEFNVSKTSVPKIRSKIRTKGFKKVNFRIGGGSVISALPAIFVAAYDAQNYNPKMISHNDTLFSLVQEFNRILYLEGEFPVGIWQLKELAKKMHSNESCMDTLNLQGPNNHVEEVFKMDKNAYLDWQNQCYLGCLEVDNLNKYWNNDYCDSMMQKKSIIKDYDYFDYIESASMYLRGIRMPEWRYGNYCPDIQNLSIAKLWILRYISEIQLAEERRLQNESSLEENETLPYLIDVLMFVILFVFILFKTKKV